MSSSRSGCRAGSLLAARSWARSTRPRTFLVDRPGPWHFLTKSGAGWRSRRQESDCPPCLRRPGAKRVAHPVGAHHSVRRCRCAELQGRGGAGGGLTKHDLPQGRAAPSRGGDLTFKVFLGVRNRSSWGKHAACNRGRSCPGGTIEILDLAAHRAFRCPNDGVGPTSWNATTVLHRLGAPCLRFSKPRTPARSPH